MMKSFLVGIFLAHMAFSQTSLDEPNPMEYYPQPAGDGAPPRVSGLSREEFMKLAAAGKPFVVTDFFENKGGKMPMEGWTCDSIRATFADGKMKQEYTNQHTDNQKIGDKGWMSQKVPSSENSSVVLDVTVLFCTSPLFVFCETQHLHIFPTHFLHTLVGPEWRSRP